MSPKTLYQLYVEGAFDGQGATDGAREGTVGANGGLMSEGEDEMEDSGRCPNCGNNRVYWVGWLTEDEHLECASCGTRREVQVTALEMIAAGKAAVDARAAAEGGVA